MAFDVQFYQLLSSPLERALPKLLEKAVAADYRVLVLNESEPRLSQLNDLLWTYDPNSFLPHGMVKDGRPNDQPVLLSVDNNPENNASLVIVTDGRDIPSDAPYARLLDVFDGQNDTATQSARERWTRYKAAGCNVSYLKQTATGGWEKVA